MTGKIRNVFDPERCCERYCRKASAKSYSDAGKWPDRRFAYKNNVPSTTANSIDLKGLTLLPGFIDVHIHGAVGVDTMEATVDDLNRMALYLAANGVTAWFADSGARSGRRL